MTSLAQTVLARYKAKKRVRTQDGDARVVYEYSDRQVAHRHHEKAKRYEKLKAAIDKLRAKVRQDLGKNNPEVWRTALAVGLLDETFERIGNDESAEERGHFGVTGWTRKHVTFGKGSATIRYVGKSGVKHEKKVSDAVILKALRRAYDAIEGEDTCLFDCEGCKIDATKVNAYLKPFGFTAKDMRGFHANRVMRESLSRIRSSGKTLSDDPKKREAQLKKEFAKALDETAEAVGHEAATLRSQYLTPGVEDQFVKDGTVMKSMTKGATEHVLDLDWVDGLRRDFLTLLKNLPRVRDYATAIRLSEAFNIYRERFEDVFYKQFLNRDFKYHSGMSEGDISYYDKRLRKSSWDLVTEMQPPIERTYEYRPSEEGQFAEYERKAPQWKSRIQRKAQVFWKDMRELLDYYKRTAGKPGFDVQIPDEDQTVLEGFRVLVRGFDPDRKGAGYSHRDALSAFKEGLEHYRKRAAKVMPWLIQHALPIVLEFEIDLNKGGEFTGREIVFYASNILGEGPGRIAQVLAHEMGHFLWRQLGKDATDFWYTALRGDYGELDVQEILDKWPGDAWAFEMGKVLADKDPILGLQIEAITHSGMYSRNYQRKEDFQALLDKGTKTIVVPKTPITGYANKNAEEAFCETIGMLVGYGPMTVHDMVKGWLNAILPGMVRVARVDPLTSQVARRHVAAYPFAPMDPAPEPEVES